MSWTPKPKRALTFARLKTFLQEHKALTTDLKVNNIPDSLCLRRDFFTSSKNNLVISTGVTKKGTYVWKYSVGSGSYDSDLVIIEPDIKYRYEVKVVRKTGVTSTGTTTTAVIAGTKYTVPSFSPKEGYRLNTITYKKCDGTTGTTSSGSKLTINCDTTITVTAVKQYNITVTTESGTLYGGEEVNAVVATVDSGSSWSSNTFTVVGQGDLNIVSTPTDNVTINNGVVSISSVEDDYTIISSTLEIVVPKFNITIITDGNSYYQGQHFSSQSPYVIELSKGTTWDSGNNAVTTDSGYLINNITISPTPPSNTFIYDSNNGRLTVRNILNNYTITITSKIIVPAGDPESVKILGSSECLDANTEPELGVNFVIVDNNDNEVNYNFIQKTSKSALTTKGDYYIEWNEGTEDPETGIYTDGGYTVYLKWESENLLTLSGLCVGAYVGYSSTVSPAPMYSGVTDVGLELVDLNFLSLNGSGRFSFYIAPEQYSSYLEVILLKISISTTNIENLDININSLTTPVSGQLNDGTNYTLNVVSPYECSVFLSNIQSKVDIRGTVIRGHDSWWKELKKCTSITTINKIVKLYYNKCSSDYTNIYTLTIDNLNLPEYLGKEELDSRDKLPNNYKSVLINNDDDSESTVPNNYLIEDVNYPLESITIVCNSVPEHWYDPCSDCTMEVIYLNEREDPENYGVIPEKYGTVNDISDTPDNYNITGVGCRPLESLLSRGTECYPNNLYISNIISLMDSNFESQCNYCLELNHKPSKYTLELLFANSNDSINIDGVSISTNRPYVIDIDPYNFTGLGLIENKDLRKILELRVKIECKEGAVPEPAPRPSVTCLYLTNITPHLTPTNGGPSLGLYNLSNPKNVSFTATMHVEYSDNTLQNISIDLFSYCTYSVTPASGGDNPWRVTIKTRDKWKLNNCSDTLEEKTLFNSVVDFDQNPVTIISS